MTTNEIKSITVFLESGETYYGVGRPLQHSLINSGKIPAKITTIMKTLGNGYYSCLTMIYYQIFDNENNLIAEISGNNQIELEY
jgi:hypothetical protein